MDKVLALLVALAPAMAAAVDVRGVDLQPAAGGTRVVIHLSEAADFALFTLSDPERVVVDLRDVNAVQGLGPPAVRTGLVTGLRHARRGRQSLRLVLDLRASALVRRELLPSGGDGSGHLLVIDLLDPHTVAAYVPPALPRGLAADVPATGRPASGTAAAGTTRTASAMERLEQRIAELEKSKTARDDATRALVAEQVRLERRLSELETTKVAQEEATRTIIRDSVSTLGSRVNESVSLGGALEVLAGWSEDFEGKSDGTLVLATAELDLEIDVNEWTKGRFVVEYQDGTDTLFTTRTGSESAVDRINVQAANITLGDPQRFPLSGTFGRMTVPFGISTGDAVADTLNIEDPLTIEAFETREDALLVGIAFPTPQPRPAPPPVVPPQVQPQLLNPAISAIGRGLGYEPPPRPPPSPAPVTATPAPPAFNVGVYFYDGDTREAGDSGWSPDDHFGATLGFRTRGACDRPYDQITANRHLLSSCPWSIDVDVDYNNSVFDSLYLESEYRPFLEQIGHVPGMAASVKATVGPVSLIGEWNGAIDDATFIDGVGRFIRIRPSAWQVSLGYQFDWNPWVETIGEQGTYLAIGYSESHDLAGVIASNLEGLTRVGNVPRRRFLVSVGEWVLDGVKFAAEYSYNVDYSRHEGGSGRSANGFFSMLTYVW